MRFRFGRKKEEPKPRTLVDLAYERARTESHEKSLEHELKTGQFTEGAIGEIYPATRGSLALFAADVLAPLPIEVFGNYRSLGLVALAAGRIVYKGWKNTRDRADEAREVAKFESNQPASPATPAPPAS